jgi:hypothetical protein
VSLGATAYFQDFDGYAGGADPVGWLDSGANNSLVEDDSLFKVFDLSGEKVFGTTSTLTNIHSHYVDPDIDILSGYEYTGRMMINSGGGGIGVTFFSQYLSADSYYRLRRYEINSFHISPHGTAVTGDTDTGVVPVPNVWYRFNIQVEDTGTQTEIRAKVWVDGSVEPALWQAECYDESPTRLTAGTMGVWSYNSGSKYWDDLTVNSLGSPPVIPPPDTTPPIISNVQVTSITETTAIVSWTTNEPSDSEVQYDSASRLWGSYPWGENDTSLVASHSINLTGLNASTTYYFRVGSIDGSGNGPTTSNQMSFSTAPSPNPPNSPSRLRIITRE